MVRKRFMGVQLFNFKKFLATECGSVAGEAIVLAVVMVILAGSILGRAPIVADTAEIAHYVEVEPYESRALAFQIDNAPLTTGGAESAGALFKRSDGL